jgi:hypothetical protein
LDLSVFLLVFSTTSRAVRYDGGGSSLTASFLLCLLYQTFLIPGLSDLDKKTRNTAIIAEMFIEQRERLDDVLLLTNGSVLHRSHRPGGRAVAEGYKSRARLEFEARVVSRFLLSLALSFALSLALSLALSFALSLALSLALSFALSLALSLSLSLSLSFQCPLAHLFFSSPIIC